MVASAGEATSGRGDEGVGGGEKQGCGLAGPEDLGADEGAIDEQGELAGEFIWARHTEPIGDGFESAAHFELVCGSDLAGRVIELGEFGRGVDLRAAAVVVAADALADPGEVGIEFGGGVVRVLASDPVPGAPEVVVFALEEGGDEIVLGAEVAVEAGFGNARFFNDEVDADGADAVLVEEGAGGIQDAGAHFGVVRGVRGV